MQFFGVKPAATEMEIIDRQSQTYSKSLAEMRPFVADAAAKQRAASDRVREMADRWAGEPYRLLEQKRLEIQPS
jgi:hypothetical protein